jgi:hypothetical protein
MAQNTRHRIRRSRPESLNSYALHQKEVRSTTSRHHVASRRLPKQTSQEGRCDGKLRRNTMRRNQMS